MRKLRLFLSLAFVATLFLQSCNKKADLPSMYALVTVREFSEGFYAISDEDELIYAGNTSRIPKYEANDGQRAIMYFTPLEEKMENFDYNADIYDMVDILTKKPVVLASSQNDTLGTSAIDIDKAWIGGGYLNIEFSILTDFNSTHEINIVDNQIIPSDNPTFDGHLKLELKHKTSLSANLGQYAKGMVCFSLEDYGIKEDAFKVVDVTYKSVKDENEVTLKVDVKEEE